MCSGKKYEYIFFDLDGTLTDPGMGITNSVMYALEKTGTAVPDRSELYDFIGPPLKDSFVKHFGFSEDMAYTAIKYYREYFLDKGIFENVIIDGVAEMLDTLSAAGYKLVLATSKPEPFAVRIMKHFGILDRFVFVAGALLDETRTHKDEVIAYALTSCGVTDVSKVLMVGDRENDVSGAKKCGLDSVGVLFGYGSRTELEEAGATFIVASPSELISLLLAK